MYHKSLYTLLRTTTLCLFFSLQPFVLAAQEKEITPPSLPQPKRFINKIEVFAGPSMSFNHGNMFVDNYKDKNIANKRMLKPGYVMGVGMYHPLASNFDLNLRVQYEQKGTKAEINTPSLIIKSQYDYQYFTASFLPTYYLGRNKTFFLTLGLYYSIIKSVSGNEYVFNKTDEISSTGDFNGRSVRGFDSDGGVNRLGFSPGIQSFQKNDFGVTVGFGYYLLLKDQHSISIRMIDNFGLQNINKPVFAPSLPGNPEKNHTVSLLVSYVYKRF